MERATVVGLVVATQAHASLVGVRLLLVRPAAGAPYVAADSTQAGPGDEVWVVHGREGALALPTPFAPIDAAIVGIVDASG